MNTAVLTTDQGGRMGGIRSRGSNSKWPLEPDPALPPHRALYTNQQVARGSGFKVEHYSYVLRELERTPTC